MRPGRDSDTTEVSSDRVETDGHQAVSSEPIDDTSSGKLMEGTLGRGLYDFPKLHPSLGQLSLTPEARAQAMAGRDRVRLQPSGAYAANLLGLSEQVPANVVFLTDGPSRLVQVGPMTLQLRRTTPRNMAAAGRPAGLVIQAFRHLGPEHITRSWRHDAGVDLTRVNVSAMRKVISRTRALLPS